MEHLRPIVEKTEHLLKRQGRVILALDGMAAAGKTTAAAKLSAHWHAPVVHMDDFFLPPELRIPERLSQPGGNVHYERFVREVLPGLQVGTDFSYGVFDCSVMAVTNRKSIPAAPVTIVEGAYSMHPVFGKYWDLSVFFAIGIQEQKRRILARSGEAAWESFHTRWIPMENNFHTAFETQKLADIVLQNDL